LTVLSGRVAIDKNSKVAISHHSAFGSIHMLLTTLLSPYVSNGQSRAHK